MAKITEEQGEQGEIRVELASGIVKIEEKNGVLHVQVLARANNGAKADANVTLTIVNQDSEQKHLNWRVDASLYSYNGRIIAKNKTLSPFRETVIADKT